MKQTLMGVDDDRFRQAGSPYEYEEVVAIAVVAIGARIDWSEGRSPDAAVWLPESLFLEVACNTRLQSINIYEQTRLSAHECGLLCEELTQVAETSSSPDLRTASTLIREQAERVITLGNSHVLLVEGP